MLARFKSIYFPFFSAILLILYFILRLGWQDTIEFGYDQPRLSFVVQDFLRGGSFLRSQSYALESPWGNFSWGPALVYFYATFFLFSPDPLVVSSLAAVFNALSIGIVIYIGKRYFSPIAGLFAGLFLVSHPWWEIFSRMVYQPTPVPTFVALSMLFMFLYLEKPKSYFGSVLILTWGVLAQLYLSCFSIIAPSGLIYLTRLRKHFSFKYIIAGILLVTFIFIPSIHYYSDNPKMIKAFTSAPDKFEGPKKPLIARFLDVAEAYFEIVPGGGFHWQLGYADEIFHSRIKINSIAQVASTVIIYLVLISSCISLFLSETKHRLYRLLLLLWAIGPLWFMTFVRVPDLLPRYFILALPALSLLFGISLHDWMKLFFKYRWTVTGYSLNVIPLALSIWWIFYIVNYFSFIQNYDYPLGPLSNFSDIPYSFLNSSMNWIADDATLKGYKSYIVSTDINKPSEPALNTATDYYWEYVLKKEVLPAKDENTKYYLLHYTSQPPLSNGGTARFGPYLVYEYK